MAELGSVQRTVSALTAGRGCNKLLNKFFGGVDRLCFGLGGLAGKKFRFPL